ncbi:MAG: T9SS type A sorting domain-containing protein [Cyclobacteriaceae bacterium]|nr:T9SS type A sorting domain-containing protein [Cyclobacteriaceae bacterium]
MNNQLNWFLSLLAVLAFTYNQSIAQQIKRQSISSYGSGQLIDGVYFNQTVGQPYFTSIYRGSKVSVTSGFQQEVTPATSSEQLKVDLISLHVFPNPTTAGATIEISELIDEASIQITNISGKVMLKDHISSTNKYEIDCGHWQAGIYFVSILSTNKQNHTSKFIISK